MDPKQKKTLIIIAALAALFVVGVVFLVVQNKKLPIKQGGRPASPDVFRPDNPKALPTVEGGTREIISEKIETPDPGATGVKSNVAVPVSLVPVGAGFLRTFELKGEGNKIVPDTIVVNDGDLVKIVFTAVDGDYNISFPDFGLGPKINKGETINFRFQATGFGEYKFSCTLCKPEASGKLIVNKK